MRNTPLGVLAEIIQESFSGIRKKDVECIKRRKPEELARFTALGLRRSIVEFLPLTPTCVEIGQKVLNGCGPDARVTERMRNIRAYKIGFHFLHILAKGGAITISKGPKKRDKYMVHIKNIEYIDDLIADLNEFRVDAFVAYTEPQFVEPQPFESFYHPIAGPLVRNTHPDAWKHFSVLKTPRVFETINKMQANKYEINTDLLDVYTQSLGDELFTFDGKKLNEKQKESKIREQNTILSIAEGIGYRYFFQYMFMDWRGRIYPATSYLNNAGHKLSKGLIKFEERKPITEDGYYYLLVYAATCWGEDKLNAEGRYAFALSKLTEWLETAKDPVKNKIWQVAESPFEFLPTIMEILKAHKHKGGKFNYPSGLIVSWDATCSGLQILGALSRDRHSGELSNIAKTDVRGDYYKMIADKVWEECVYDEQDEKAFDKVVKDLAVLEKAVNGAKGKKKAESWEKLVDYTRANGKNIYALSKVYWGRKELSDRRRKICKRSCMTYFYSCGENSMADALIEDFSPEPEHEHLNRMFALWLTRRIYKACAELMKKPTELMSLFIALGKKDYDEGKDFSLKAPFTNFHMEQYYRQDKVEQVKTVYLGTLIQPIVTIGINGTRDYTRVLSGSSPNVVHMLDAVIVAVVTINANYDVATVHDSFGASVADAPKLYKDTRSAFVEVFEEDVLTQLTNQKGVKNNVEYGDLDVREAMDNDYCFL